MAVEWKNPPEPISGVGSHKWASIADELRAAPHVWALVAEDISASLSTHLRNGRTTGWPKGDFEIRSVTSTRPRVDIYARYIGGV